MITKNKTKQKYKIEIYIGSDNKTHKINTDYLSLCEEITLKFYEGFNIEFILGVYKGLKEDSLKITILTQNIKPIKALCNDLRITLKQESILYTINKTIYNFI